MHGTPTPPVAVSGFQRLTRFNTLFRGSGQAWARQADVAGTRHGRRQAALPAPVGWLCQYGIRNGSRSGHGSLEPLLRLIPGNNIISFCQISAKIQ